MKKILIIAFTSLSLMASSYDSATFLNMAKVHKLIIENNAVLSESNTAFFLQSREFRGYVASLLDFSPELSECTNLYSLSNITYQASRLISTSKTNKDTNMRISTLVALDMICNPKKKK